jgi:hypothetical protein
MRTAPQCPRATRPSDSAMVEGNRCFCRSFLRHFLFQRCLERFPLSDIR